MSGEYNCTICGKDFKNGDPAYATTVGSIEEDIDGFYQSDFEGWLTVACEDCGKKISEYIFKLMRQEAVMSLMEE